MKRYMFPILVLFLLQGTFFLNGQDHSDFYDLNTIQEIKLTFENDSWRNSLDSLRYNGDGMLLGNIEINGQQYTDVGVRYWLGSSYQGSNYRNDLHIQLDLVKSTQKHAGHSIIKLSSAVRDPSMVREVLAYSIAAKYMPASHANFANVYINDELSGLYVNVEPIDNGFLEENFGTSSGDFYFSQPKKDDMRPLEGCNNQVYGTLKPDNYQKCFEFNFNDINNTGFGNLMRLVSVLNRSNEKIEDILDVDKTLWMLAFNNVIGNLDSYNGLYSANYYLYKDRFGKFIPIIWDMNLSFGSYKNTGTGSDLRTREMMELDPLLHVDNADKPLISILLKNESYQKVYLSHIRTILYENFINDDFEAKVKELQEMIKPAFVADPNKYYELADFEKSSTQVIGKKSKIPGIATFMKERAQFLKKHPKLLIVPSNIEDAQFERREKYSNNRVKSFNLQLKVTNYPKKVFVYYRYANNELYKSARAFDDGQHNDEKANDGIFGVTIQPSSEGAPLQYYYFVENAGSVSFDPPRYMYEPYSVTLDQLNK